MPPLGVPLVPPFRFPRNPGCVVIACGPDGIFMALHCQIINNKNYVFGDPILVGVPFLCPGNFGGCSCGCCCCRLPYCCCPYPCCCCCCCCGGNPPNPPPKFCPDGPAGG